MEIKFRNYQSPTLFSTDYTAVRAFLVEQNKSFFHFGRFDWMVTHSLLEPLATDPLYRRRGLAKAIVYEGLRRLKARGYRYVMV